MVETIRGKTSPEVGVEAEWTKFDDFKRAVDQLPPELKLAFVRLKPPEAHVIQEPRSETIRKVSWALDRLYTRAGKIFSSRPLFAGNDKEVHDAFIVEIDTLWSRRQDQPPIPLIYSREFDVGSMRAHITSLENAYAEAKERFIEVARKMKTMGPKKRQRFWSEQRGYFLEENEKNLLSQIIGAGSSLKRIEEGKKAELALRVAVNQYIVMLTGDEYFEAQLSVVDGILLRSSLGERIGKKLEDALLEWALIHGKDPAIVKPQKTEDVHFRKDNIENFRPALQRLLNELQRIYPVVRDNPSSANLKHAQLLYKNSLRLFQR